MDTLKARIDAARGRGPVQVTVTHAPQFYPTPHTIARVMVERLGLEPGARVLEPSAGSGNLVQAIFSVCPSAEVCAVEINYQLSASLERFDHCYRVTADFLETMPEDFKPFDAVVMNPPFSKGSDIAHILHALGFLKPGGLLVALCAGGLRQREKLQPIAESWEDLPPGTFAEAGTGVNVALLTIIKSNLLNR